MAAVARGPCGLKSVPNPVEGGTEQYLEVELARPLDTPERGIGIVADVSVEPSPEGLLFDLDDDHARERFTICTSREGIHANVWSGDEKRWNAYQYLGYDVEPSCTPAEVK